VSLPAKSGYELCEHIRGPLGLLTVPIIVTGESGHAHDMAFAEAAGANAFLRKPFTRLQLTACVSSLLDRSARVPRPTHELAPLGLATLAQGLNRLTPQIVPGARDGLALPLAALPVRWPAIVEADVVEPRRVYSSRALLRPAGLTAL
jgi:CheY-like chemotaxis protein